MLHKGEINYHGQCFTLYTQGARDPLINFCYQLAKKLFPTTSPSIAARRIREYLTDGFDRYKITEIREDAN